MSIAINSRRTVAIDRTRRQQATVVAYAAPSQQEQLRDMRTLLRHLVLAFAAVAAVSYAVIASGIAI